MFDYIKTYYNLPFIKKNMDVEFEGKKGKITGARGQYLKIMLEGQKQAGYYHPTYNLKYFDQNGQEIPYKS